MKWIVSGSPVSWDNPGCCSYGPGCHGIGSDSSRFSFFWMVFSLQGGGRCCSTSPRDPPCGSWRSFADLEPGNSNGFDSTQRRGVWHFERWANMAAGISTFQKQEANPRLKISPSGSLRMLADSSDDSIRICRSLADSLTFLRIQSTTN